MKLNGKSYPTCAACAINATWLRWSPVNQAWFLMWHNQVLRIISDKHEACAEYDRLLNRHDDRDI